MPVWFTRRAFSLRADVEAQVLDALPVAHKSSSVLNANILPVLAVVFTASDVPDVGVIDS
jgi:hypothetical protein